MSAPCPAGPSAPMWPASLKTGDELRVEGPFGFFLLRDGHRGPIVALAGGSGLAPIRSIVGEALRRNMPQDIRLYFGARDERDLYLLDEFAALAARHSNLHFIPVLSEPRGETARRTGFCTRRWRRIMPTSTGPRPILRTAADGGSCRRHIEAPPRPR